MSDVTLKFLCASHGVDLNAQDDAANLEAVAAIGDGTLIKALFALIVKYGPQLAPIIPQLLAALATGNYMAAIMLIINALAPKPADAV